MSSSGGLPERSRHGLPGWPRTLHAWAWLLAATGMAFGAALTSPAHGESRPATHPAGSLASGATGSTLDASSEGGAYYKKKCLACHGATGAGDGPGARKLETKPRSFRDPEWQRTITDERIKKVTVEGGVANGLTAAMPAYIDLRDRTDLQDALVTLLRSFRDE